MDLLKKPDLEARISCVFSRLILFDEPDLFSPMGRKSPQTLGKSSVCGPREMVPVAGVEPARHRWRWILSFFKNVEVGGNCAIPEVGKEVQRAGCARENRPKSAEKVRCVCCFDPSWHLTEVGGRLEVEFGQSRESAESTAINNQFMFNHLSSTNKHQGDY